VSILRSAVRLRVEGGERRRYETEVHVKYLLALFGDEAQMADMSEEEAAAGMEAWDAFTREATEAGAFLGGEGLQPTATATTVRIPADGGTPAVTDGPFAETKEQLGGYYLLDCPDLDAALAWAHKIPLQGGSVEVRPVMDYEAVGSAEHASRPEVSR
jgi:hypothetical protein